MNAELNYLRQIVESIINNGNSKQLDEDTKEDILNEFNKLKLLIHCFAPGKEHTSKDFIHLQLNSFTRLIKEIEDFVGSSPNLDTISVGHLELIKSELQNLIDYIWTYYPAEFDLKIIVSRSAISRYLKKTEERFNSLLSYLSNLEIAQDLKEILADTFLLRISEVISYNIISTNESIANYLEASELPPSEEEIAILLISHQFNHPRFYKFCKVAIAEKLNRLSVISDHFRELIFMRKTLIQIPLLKIIPYSPQSDSIQKLLLKMIDSELDFLKELDFINTELVNSGMLDSNYKVSLSVKQLAFYIYLNVEVGIITEQKATRIHQYVISHVSTAEKQEISEKSFSNGYYVHTPEDIRKVSDKLARMLAIAQDKY